MKFVLIIVSFTTNIICTTSESNDQTIHTDIVLAGALGDLSQKYLWQGLFELFTKYGNGNNGFSFYGISRDSYEDGTMRLTKILQERVTCKEQSEICVQKRHEFIQKVRYFQLKTDQHFENFGAYLKSKSAKSKVLKEGISIGRIFYFAIPPSAYSSMAAKFHNCCLLREGDHWTRLVLEKPFGSDTDSALKMAEDIQKYFKEEEIYRIDHYLGKSVVKQILPFR